MKKKLLSMLIALSLIASMGTTSLATGVSADEPTDVTETTSEIVTSVEDNTEVATGVTEKVIGTEAIESTEATDITGVTEPTEVCTETSTEVTTVVSSDDGEALKAEGGVFYFDTYSVPLAMFNGVTYKVVEVDSNKEIANGKIQADDDTTTSGMIMFGGTLEENKKYKISFGNLTSDMGVSRIAIMASDIVVEDSAELEFTAAAQIDETGKEYVASPSVQVSLQYAEGNFIKVYNETRQGKPIKGVMVNVTYGGSTKPYVTDDTGCIVVPIYNDDWDITISGNDNENHVLLERTIAGNEMYKGSVGLFEYAVTWDDGDTHYSIWGYDSDYSAILKTKVNHIYDTSLYDKIEPKVTVGVFKKGDSTSVGEFTIDNEEFKIPAYDNGEYELKVINAGGYNVKFSSDTFTAGKDETITAELTPIHYLTVVKKVGGKTVNASFTIRDKKYESECEHTFETHPEDAVTVVDNDTKEEFDVVLPSQYEGVILTLGDNPDVELVGLIEDKGDGSTTGGSVVGSNSNPKTYDGIMGVAAGLSLCGVGAGYLIYRKKKKFNL